MNPAELLELAPSEVWQDVWKQLGRAARDPRHPFRLPVVATRCPDRGVRARTVVLRASCPSPATLSLFTDRRAGKLSGLAVEPRVSWCFYDARHRVQVRAETRAVLRSGDEEARIAWRTQGPSARRLYRVTPAPGSILPEDWDPPAADESDAGFEHFAVVNCAVEEIEWLVLAREGHRRLRFQPDAEGDWLGEALVP